MGVWKEYQLQGRVHKTQLYNSFLHTEETQWKQNYQLLFGRVMVIACWWSAVGLIVEQMLTKNITLTFNRPMFMNMLTLVNGAVL